MSGPFKCALLTQINVVTVSLSRSPPLISSKPAQTSTDHLLQCLVMHLLSKVSPISSTVRTRLTLKTLCYALSRKTNSISYSRRRLQFLLMKITAGMRLSVHLPLEQTNDADQIKVTSDGEFLLRPQCQNRSDLNASDNTRAHPN